MSATRFQLAQGEVKSISNPARITGIGGDNATEFYINLPNMPPGAQWVFPFTYGFMFVVDAPSYQPVKVDASQTPPGGTAAPTTTKIAQLSAYDTDVSFSPGITSNVSGVQRWNINNAPATGSQATVARAAASGVTHIADSFQGTLTQTSTGTTAATFTVLDGAATLFLLIYSCPGVVGTTVQAGPFGPGMNLRGSPNNAMTIKWSVGITGVAEAVNMNGYDQ